jgi:ATP-dependent phosphofructokinase / diphosphate-dependent phosphofructokinase
LALHRVKCIGILTGGGDCPGLNAVIRAVVKNASQHNINVIGIQDGFLGLMEKNMRLLELEDVSGILTLGGTILGSSNKDNPFHMREKAPSGKVISHDRSREIPQTLKRLGIEALVVLGGDGSMTVANKLSRMGIQIVGVPKTIDNDLMGTDQTFGYDTAVSIATEAIDRLHTVAASHHRVMIVEVMGRYAGWLALGSGIAGGGDIILIPEIPYDEKKVGEAIWGRRKMGKKSSIIVIAEGAHSKGGRMAIDRVNPLSSDRIRLGGISRELAHHLETKSGIECRAVILGHVVRGGCPTAFDRNLATLFGVHAMELVLKGQFGRMVALKNTRISSVLLSQVGGRVRKVPLDHEWIKAAKSIGVEFGT